MDPGERTTGTRDEHYNLITVLYHALHGAENCEIYAAAAEVAGRDELAAFFLEAQAEQIEQLADRAKELLGIGGAVPGAAGGATVGGGIVPEDIPPTTDVPPTPLESEPEDVDRGISPEPSSRMADRVGDDFRTETTTPPDNASPDVDVAPPGREDVSPEAPRMEGVPRVGEEPPEAERGTTTSGREYFSNLIGETDRRSRGEI